MKFDSIRSSSIETHQSDFWILTIDQDELSHSPRETEENFCQMVLFHRDYIIGDTHKFSSYEDFLLSLIPSFSPETNLQTYLISNIQEADLETLEHFASKTGVLQPLYLFDYSGLSISTQSFGSTRDTGKVGYAYISYDDIRKQKGTVDESSIEWAKQVIAEEVNIYDLYLKGEMYAYTLYKKTPCHCGNELCSKQEIEEHDTSFGFLGRKQLDSYLYEHLSSLNPKPSFLYYFRNEQKKEIVNA